MIDSNELDEHNKIPDDLQKTIKLRKSSFASDVLKMVSGTTFSQIFGIIASPILSRLFTPTEFGIYQIFTSIWNMISVIASLRYELTIVLPEEDSDAVNLLAVSSFFSLLIGLMTIPVFLIWGESICVRLKAPQLYPWLWLISLNVILMGIYTSLNYWNIRTKNFGRLSATRVTNSLVSAGGQMGIGFLGNKIEVGLIIGTMIGTIASTGQLAWQIWKNDSRKFISSLSLKRMLELMVRFKKFPMFNTWSALLNNVSVQLPAFMLSSAFSSTIVGYFSMGNRILRMPLMLIGTSLSQVFFQRVSVARRDGTLPDLVYSLFARMVTLGLFPFVLLTFVGEEMYIIIFGAQWAQAGVYTEVLSIWTFFVFINAPISILFTALEKQEASLLFNAALFITRFLSLYAGIQIGDAYLTLFLYSITGVVMYALYSFWIIKVADVSLKKVALHFLRILLLSTPLILIIVFVKAYSGNPWVILSTSFILILAYYATILIIDKQINSIFKGWINKLTKKIPE